MDMEHNRNIHHVRRAMGQIRRCRVCRVAEINMYASNSGRSLNLHALEVTAKILLAELLTDDDYHHLLLLCRMSKETDADLYEGVHHVSSLCLTTGIYRNIIDLYGAEEVSLEAGDEAPSRANSRSPTQARSSPSKLDTLPSSNGSTLQDTRPPTEKSSKDVTSPSAASLSYSAQIAQQFSSYQQTPSQERQQRAGGTHSLPQPLGKTGPISSYESRTQNDGISAFPDRAIRPSEMKDEG